MDVNITKLPDIIDPNIMIKKLIKEKYESVCPVCGEARDFFESCVHHDNYSTRYGVTSYSYQTWYGYPDELDSHKKWYSGILRHLKGEKYHHYRINRCCCFTCGTDWSTPAFPTDILSEDEVHQIYDEIFKSKKPVEVQEKNMHCNNNYSSYTHELW